MPVCHIRISSDFSVYVWRIEEDLGELLQMARLSDSEGEKYSTYRSESRKCQWLAVRACANEVIGRKVCISYDAVVRPILNDETFKYISISHADNYVALLLSNCPHIGVDIESVSRKYQKVATKYVSDDERLMFEQQEIAESQYLPITWCTKEAAFKALLLEDVDFVNDIRVISVDNSSSDCTHGTLSVRYLPLQAIGIFKFEAFEGHYLVWGKYEDI